MNALLTQAEEARYLELQSLALDFARTGNTTELGAMVRHGLPVNLADPKGNTLLLLASYHGHLETTAMLLAAKADPNRRNDRGQTCLGGVAFKGYVEIAALLLSCGAQIDSDNGAGMTPLMFAALFGRTEMVRFLTEAGASLQQRNRLGLSARLLVSFSRLVGRFRSQPVRRGT
jgi:ankyrin repeat protein